MALDTRKIKLVILDFDGVLTDNFVYINELGEESVKCCKSDSVALDLLKSKGLKFIVLTGEKKLYVTFRCKKIGIDYKLAINSKSTYLDYILNTFKVNKNEILFIGNDLNDLDLMKEDILTGCPSDSHKDIIKISDIKFETKGGYGILRELYDICCRRNWNKSQW